MTVIFMIVRNNSITATISLLVHKSLLNNYHDFARKSEFSMIAMIIHRA
jgi:hypothetical protein